MNADNTNGGWLLHFANGVVTHLVRIAPPLVTIDRIENVTNVDLHVATTAKDGKMLAVIDAAHNELKLLDCHDLPRTYE